MFSIREKSFRSSALNVAHQHPLLLMFQHDCINHSYCHFLDFLCVTFMLSTLYGVHNYDNNPLAQALFTLPFHMRLLGLKAGRYVSTASKWDLNKNCLSERVQCRPAPSTVPSP